MAVPESRVIVVIGPPCSGKTTLVNAICSTDSSSFRSLDFDDVMPASFRQQMAAGQPLTDSQRDELLAAFVARIDGLLRDAAGPLAVLCACVLPRQRHRRQLYNHYRSRGVRIDLVHLHSDDAAVLKSRLAARLEREPDHFFSSPAVLDRLLAQAEPFDDLPHTVIDHRLDKQLLLETFMHIIQS